MKSVKIKIISFLLAAVTVFSSFPVTVLNAGAVCTLKISGAVLTGDQSEDIVAVAKANLDKTGSSLGATEHWCADFVYACAEKANIDKSVIPAEGGVSVLKQALLSKGAKKVTSPRRGDLVFFGTSHVGIMDGSLYCYNGNFSGKGDGASFWKSSKVVYCKYTSTSNYKKHGAEFIRPKYVNNRFVLTLSYKAEGASVSSKYYKLASDKVYKSDGTLLKDIWYYNTPHSGGLYKASAIGLSKTGYTFGGWKNSDGKILAQGDPSVLPSDIYPNIKKGNASTVLSAVWQPNVLTVTFSPGEGKLVSKTYCADKGIICTSSGKKKLTVSMSYGEGKKATLPTAEALGLTAENKTFCGWSLSENGKAKFDPGASLWITDICPDIKTGSRDITLYACFTKNEKQNKIQEDTQPQAEPQQEEIPILSEHTEHKAVIDPEIPATCTKGGISEGSHCEICGEILTKGENTAPLGHDFSTEFTVDVQPTCKAAGSKSKHCIRCDEKTDVTSVKKSGHEFTASVTAATLTADGKKCDRCVICGEEKNIKAIAKIKTVTLAKAEYVYDGKAKTPAVTVKDSGGNTLKSGTDYTVTYKNNKATGTAQAVVSFKGSYSGTKSLSFDIMPEKVTGISVKPKAASAYISWSKVKGATGYRVYTYNTKSKKYTLVSTVKTNSFTANGLKANTYYSYYIKWYKTSGGKTVSPVKYGAIGFTTILAATSFSKLTPSVGGAGVSWKKVSGAEGYEVYMAPSKDGTYKKVYDTYKLSMTQTGLKTGKTYYFKVRAYKRVSGVKVYSMFSSSKGVKIK